MRARKIGSIEEGSANKLDELAIFELAVYYPDELVTYFGREVEVFVESIQAWVPLEEAMKKKLVITDNYEIYFREPLNDEERERGYYY